MDSDSEAEEEQEGSPAATPTAAQQAATQQQACGAAEPSGAAAAASAGGPEPTAAAALGGSWATLPEKYRPGAASGKRKAEGEPEAAAEPSGRSLGECGQHVGPCNDQCAALHGSDAAAPAKQAAGGAAAALEPEQRQPKRRRKKLHDLSGVGALGITGAGLVLCNTWGPQSGGAACSPGGLAVCVVLQQPGSLVRHAALLAGGLLPYPPAHPPSAALSPPRSPRPAGQAPLQPVHARPAEREGARHLPQQGRAVH